MSKNRPAIEVRTFQAFKDLLEDESTNLSQFTVTMALDTQENLKVAKAYAALLAETHNCHALVDEMGLKRRDLDETLLARLTKLKKGGLRQR